MHESCQGGGMTREWLKNQVVEQTNQQDAHHLEYAAMRKRNELKQDSVGT